MRKLIAMLLAIASLLAGPLSADRTWVGTLARSTAGVYSFQGSWAQQNVSRSTAGTGGGPMAWALDTSTTPFNASGSFSGSTTFTVMGFSIPIAACGNWSATLPLAP